MKKLYGVTVPMVTPLTNDDKIDRPGLERLTDYLIDKKIQCLYPVGTTGEMMYLSLDERKEVAEIVTARAAGRAVVYIQAGAWNLADTIELAKHAVKIGADGIGVMTPVFFKLTEEEVIDYYKAVSASVPEQFPIYLYGIPQLAVNDITPATAGKIIAACPNVIGIKYSFNNMSRIQEFMTLKEGTFSVLCGPDELFAVTCFAGGDGTVSGNANVIPEYYESLWEAIQEEDIEKATKLQREINVLNKALSCTQNIARYKTVLKNRGIIAQTKMRAPLEELDGELERAMMETLERLHYTEG